MKIKTPAGKEFEIQIICNALRNMNRVMIVLEDDRQLPEIAADFDGLETFTKTDENKPGVEEVYKGYSNLVGVSRNTADGTVRLMLEKEA
jgi:hypothetical protein